MRRETWCSCGPIAPGHAQVAISPAEWRPDATLQLCLVVKASANPVTMATTRAYFGAVSAWYR